MPIAGEPELRLKHALRGQELQADHLVGHVSGKSCVEVGKASNSGSVDHVHWLAFTGFGSSLPG